MSNDEPEKESNKESSLNINSMKMKTEMIYLKEDLLKDLKNFERTFSEKLKLSNKLIDEKLEEFEKRLEIYNQKLFAMSQLVAEDNYLKERIEKLSKEKLEMKEQIISIDIKQDKLENQFTDKIDYVQKILNDSVIYTGIIGKNGKFINFHQFIDHILSQISSLSLSSQKQISDMKSYKTKMESNLQNIRILIDGKIKSSNQLNKQLVIESENKTNDNMSILFSKFKKYNEENIEKINNKIDQLNNNIRNDFKKEIESDKIKFEENNNKINKNISDIEKQLEDLKAPYEKLTEEIKIINEKIIEYEEIIKKEKEEKDELNKALDDFKKDKKQINEQDIVNRYLKGEINESQLLLYKEFLKLNNMIKNIINDLLEKSHDEFIKASKLKHKKFKNDNLIKYLSPYFNNIISEISTEKAKRKTVNNLVNCINLKLNYKRRDRSEQNNKSTHMRKNNSSRTFDLDDEIKLNNNNDFGYKTFQISDRSDNFRLFNNENLKNYINEYSENKERNIIQKNNRSNSKEKKIKYEKDNIVIDCEKNKNEENTVKEYSNKKFHLIKEKIVINEANKIKKDIINNSLKNSADFEKISKRKIKDNLLNKIQNNNIKGEESKQSKILNKTLNKIDKNSITMISSFKPFTGKKYIAYEKSFDAKIKEKLIHYDIDYKEKMKRNKNMRFSSDNSYIINDNTFLQMTKKNFEAENIKNMVNNLQSYIKDNSNKNKYFFTRNKINNLSHKSIKIRDNLLNEN